MSAKKLVFQIRFKKISFKQAPTLTQSLMCNLLNNNKKIDNTEPFLVPPNSKSVELSSLKPLIFNVKEQENKLPIYVYILYGQVSAKKIILKRTDMIKKYDLEQKDTFHFDQDFGPFAISYQVILKKQDVSKDQNEKKGETLIPNLFKPPVKTQQAMKRLFKRPSMLEVGQKAERIRKSSVDHCQTAQSQINIQAENSQQKLQKINPKELNQSLVPPLTLVKDQKTEQNIVKKGIKINLFQNFGNLGKKTVDHDPKHNPKKQEAHGFTHNEKAQKVYGSQKGTHDNHQENHQSHQAHKNNGGIKGSHSLHGSHRSSHGQHHDSHGQHYDSHGRNHDSHGGHHDSHYQHSEPMSLKLKTVVAMLIIGFLFLMYDALDDRFSRKVRKVENIHGYKQHDDHGHGNHHETVPKKKKGGMKVNKVSTH